MARSSARPAPRLILKDAQSASPYQALASGVPFRPVWCAKHHFTGPWPCSCPPGPQSFLMNPTIHGGPRPDKLMTGGARGGAKSASLLAVAGFQGNPLKRLNAIRLGKQPSQTDFFYITNRHYRGLILRPQANDLIDILDRAESLYGPTGAVITRGSPPMAEWPSGAKIIFGYFLDNGWRKTLGPEYQFIGIDQIEMMEQEETFHRICGSLRSTDPDLRTQVLGTFNPGGGDDMKGAPGQGWLMEYFFINFYLNGRLERYQCVIDEEGIHRLFVPSKITDNPYFLYEQPKVSPDLNKIMCASCEDWVSIPLPERPDEEINVCPLCKGKLLADGAYLKWLNGIQPESLRRAWRDGDMRALTGMYFRDFRPDGPLMGEPAEANHVYRAEEVRLEPWFHSWGALDWGFIHPADFQLYTKHPDGTTYVTTEISLRRTEPLELGVLIARQCKPIIDGYLAHNLPPNLNIYMSPDAWAKRESEDTVASQIAAGIEKEFGKGSVFVADHTQEEKDMRDPEAAVLSMRKRRSQQQSVRISLIRASTDRVAGWMHLQTMLRFRPLHGVVKPDQEIADRLYREKGLVAYKEYLSLPEFQTQPEVLPRLKINRECRTLLDTIPKAMHDAGTNDVKKFDATETSSGDDSIDALRYGCLSEERQAVAFPPIEQRVQKRMADLAEKNPGLSDHSLIMAREHARKAESGITRESRPRHAANRVAMRRAMFQDRADRSGRK